MSERPNNVVSLDTYRERKETQPTVDVAAIKKRLADIALEQLLLGSEKNRLTEQLRNAQNPLY